MADDTVYYAIGDVHGMFDKLVALHGVIAEWHDRAHGQAPQKIIHLGDYVDRGPDSQAVIDHLLNVKSSPGHEMICLMGNHERMMIDALEGELPSQVMWLRNGGRETLQSYGRTDDDFDDLSNAIPTEHVNWMRSLPTYYTADARKLCFVHAGIDPKSWPNDTEEHHLWTRSPRFFNPTRWENNAALEGWTIIHGHTPTADFEPQEAGFGRRINVDTGACFGGPLTAAVFAPDEPVRFLKV